VACEESVLVVAFAGDDCSIHDKNLKTVYYNDDNLEDPYYTAVDEPLCLEL
jgi:hypothetical protein